MGADAPMVKNSRAKMPWGLCADGCSCHNTKKTRRKAITAAKRREKSVWKKQEGVL